MSFDRPDPLDDARRVPSPPRPPDSDAPLASRSLEEITYERLHVFLQRLQGRRVPGLYRLIMGQVERALLRAALQQTGDHLGHAARLLDLDRNTLARKSRALGLQVSGKPGPKPRAGAKGGDAK